MAAKKKHTYYAPELKIQAVHAFIDEGLTRNEVLKRYDITSVSTLKKWVIAYKREGEQALQDKPRGRPQGTCSKQPPPIRIDSVGNLIMRFENDRLLRKFGE